MNLAYIEPSTAELWTAEHVAAGFCAANQVDTEARWTPDDYLKGTVSYAAIGKLRKPMPSSLRFRNTGPTWSHLEYLDGMCGKDEVGTEKVPLTHEGLNQLAEDNKLTPKQLRKDVLEAYKQLGGVKYLMKNPLLLEKLLVKIVAEDKPQVQVTNTVILPSWAGPERLAYKQNIIDAADAFEANKRITQELKD